MFTYEALAVDRPWQLEEVSPEVRALIGDDLACISDEGELDRGLILHLMYEAVYKQPEPETIEWVQTAIEARPGAWTARLCRAMHGHEENFRSVAYCGQCAGGYANPRKRERAAALQTTVLPGFEQIGGAYRLHGGCSRRDFTWLRRQIKRLVERGLIIKRREKRPDMRQARGWDYMTCLYPAKERND
jgi:hypothetical protein